MLATKCHAIYIYFNKEVQITITRVKPFSRLTDRCSILLISIKLIWILFFINSAF